MWCIYGQIITDKNDFYTLNVKSESFVTYSHCGDIGANKKKIDICKSCVEKFKEFVKIFPEGVSLKDKEPSTTMVTSSSLEIQYPAYKCKYVNPCMDGVLCNNPDTESYYCDFFYSDKYCKYFESKENHSDKRTHRKLRGLKLKGEWLFMKIGDTCFVLDMDEIVKVKFVDAEFDKYTHSFMFTFKEVTDTWWGRTYRFTEKELAIKLYESIEEAEVDKLPF